MSLSSRMLALLVLALVFLNGCGGGSSQPKPPVITGPFSNASVKGQYAFIVSGNGSSGFSAVAGSFRADGSGNLAGTMDINTPNGVLTNVAFTGTYNVIPNGQGTATFLSPAQTINLRLVVISTQGARILLSGLDNSAPGHGNADLQDATAFSTSGVAGQQAFSLSGTDAAGGPLATAGGFIADGTGLISSGVHDVSDNGTPSANQLLTGTYSVPAGTANGRGTMVLNTALGALHFAFYIVNATQLKIVETERTPALAGESFRGANDSISVAGCGPCALVWTGVSGATPFAAIGGYGVDDLGHVINVQITANTGGTVGGLTFTGGTYSFAPPISWDHQFYRRSDRNFCHLSGSLSRRRSNVGNRSRQGGQRRCTQHTAGGHATPEPFLRWTLWIQLRRYAAERPGGNWPDHHAGPAAKRHRPSQWNA